MNKPTASAEWTAEHVASFIHESYESPGHKSLLQTIADAHNAALDAERSKVKELEEELNEAVKLLKLKDIDAAIAKVRK